MNKTKILIIGLLFLIILPIAQAVGPGDEGSEPGLGDESANWLFKSCRHITISTNKVDIYDIVNVSLGQQCPEDFSGHEHGADNPDCRYEDGPVQ